MPYQPRVNILSIVPIFTNLFNGSHDNTSYQTTTQPEDAPTQQVPDAKLIIKFYDESGNFVKEEVKSISSRAASEWENLRSNLVASQNGEIEVTIVNNDTSIPVFFDNLKIQVLGDEKPLVLQENHYYPFGMNMKGIENEPEGYSKFQYNGIEKDIELGLNLLTTKFRQHDPQTGRWTSIDPEVEQFYDKTPYNHNFNNPIRYKDPDGDCPTCISGAVIGVLTETVAQIGYAMLIEGKGFKKALFGVDKTDVVVAGGTGALTGALDGGAGTLAKFLSNGKNIKMMAKVLKKGGELLAETLENVSKDYLNGQSIDLGASVTGAFAEVGVNSILPSSKHINRQVKNADKTINKMNKKINKGKTLTQRQKKSLASAKSSKKFFGSLQNTGNVIGGAAAENVGNAASNDGYTMLKEIIITPKKNKKNEK